MCVTIYVTFFFISWFHLMIYFPIFVLNILSSYKRIKNFTYFPSKLKLFESDNRSFLSNYNESLQSPKILFINFHGMAFNFTFHLKVYYQCSNSQFRKKITAFEYGILWHCSRKYIIYTTWGRLFSHEKDLCYHKKWMCGYKVFFSQISSNHWVVKTKFI